MFGVIIAFIAGSVTTVMVPAVYKFVARKIAEAKAKAAGL